MDETGKTPTGTNEDKASAERSTDTSKRDPWLTFNFKRRRSLERRAPDPDEFTDIQSIIDGE
jgi:hypothetical protein